MHVDPRHPVVQEFWLLGRFQGQYHWSQGSAGDHEGYETRRHRLGFQTRMLGKLTAHAQMVSGSDLDPFYNGFTELWLQWAFRDELVLTLGQQKHRFTHDRTASSRYINYLERGMLTNLFRADYSPAATLQGRVDRLTYYTGIFSNTTSRNLGRAFTELHSGYSLLANAYYDLGAPGGLRSAHFNFCLLHSEARRSATLLNRFRQGASGAAILTHRSTALIAEVTAGRHDTAGDAIGLNLQPSFFLTDWLQVVGRWQRVASNQARGLAGQSRYERPAGLPPGDRYQATYLGLNVYLAKHRAKFMTGLEYARQGGQDVWTSSAMIRFYFGPHSNGPFPMNQLLNGRFFDPD